MTNPQQVIGRLHGKHLLQQFGIGANRSGTIGTIHVVFKQKRPGRLGLNTGMHQQVRALIGLGHRIQRQPGNPAHKLLVRLKFHVVKLLARRPATVDVPRLGIERVLADNGIEHNLLMVTLEHARVGQRSHQFDNTDRIGPAIDHVAQHVQRIFGRQRNLGKSLVKRTHVSVSIRCHIDRHGTPFPTLWPKPGAAAKTSS